MGARDDLQYTALHWAAVNGHINIGRLLLERGADVDALNDREHRGASFQSVLLELLPARTPGSKDAQVLWTRSMVEADAS